MKAVNVLKNITLGLFRSLKRFPVTILLSTSVVVTLIVMSEMRSSLSTKAMENFARVAMVLALGIPLSLCIKVFFERKENENSFKLIASYAVGALAIILYYFFLLDNLSMVNTTRYIGISLALYLCFLYIPYLPKREHFEMYVIKLFTGFFIAVIYSIVLYLGLSAILFTVNKLLEIHIAGKVYYYTWLLVVFVFALTYFLSEVPSNKDIITPESYPKLFRVLILYIVMPLLAVYTAILYIYFGKIIITTRWPVGIVSHLVLWYSVIVAIVIFFINPIKEQNSWANKFSKWFPRIIIPLLFMMFASIGIRINAYGVTESRYFVVILGLWSLGVMLYFGIKKEHRNIALPVTLSIIAIISVIGPLSSFSISKMSQNNRLEKILMRNNMLKDGKIQKAPSNIPEKDKVEISRILQYFNSRHSLKDVNYLPDNFKIEDTNKVFGFNFDQGNGLNEVIYFNYTSDPNEKFISVSGYDYMLDSRGLHNNASISSQDVNVYYDRSNLELTINLKGKELYTWGLKSLTSNLVEKYGMTEKQKVIPLEEMTFVNEMGNVKIKLIFTNISGTKDISTGTPKIEFAEFYLLIKLK